MSAPPSHPLRWRPLTSLLLASGVVLVLGAVAVRNPTPLFLALPLLLAPVAAGLMGSRTSPRVRVDLAVEGAAAEVHVRGAVVPESSADARDLVVEMERPPSLTGDPLPRFDYGPTQIRIRADWTAPEPTIAEIPLPNVLWRDPIGLVEREADRTGAALVVARYPPELLRVGSVRLEHTTLLPGENRSRRVGVTGEFHGIREARTGDSPRQINWRASARAGHLLANEYDLEKTGDLLIVLDARPTPLGRTVDERLFSISRAAAVGLSEAFLRVKSRVGVGVFGEFLDVVPLAAGRAQGIRIENALKRAHLSFAYAPAERCAVSARRQFPPGLTTVVFSSLSDEPSEDLSPYLRRRGFPTVVVTPSPLPILSATTPLQGEDELLGARLARLVREDRIARAWSEAPTIDWEDYWSLGRFVEFVRRPQVRRVG